MDNEFGTPFAKTVDYAKNYRSCGRIATVYKKLTHLSELPGNCYNNLWDIAKITE